MEKKGCNTLQKSSLAGALAFPDGEGSPVLSWKGWECCSKETPSRGTLLALELWGQQRSQQRFL